MVMQYLQGLLGGGGQSGPRPLTPYFGQQQQQPMLFGQPIDFNNPAIVAAMGAGGAMLSANDSGATFGQALRAGLGGGAAGFVGAQQSIDSKQESDRRDRIMRELIERMGQVGGLGGGSTQYDSLISDLLAEYGGGVGRGQPVLAPTNPLFTGLI